MGARRGNRATVTTLLLAALAFTGVVAHGHDSLAATHGHRDLPTYSGGHDQAIPGTHMEEATRIESSPCLACLHQQRHRGVASQGLALGGAELNPSILELEDRGRSVTDTPRLPASRAPPGA